MYDPAARCPLSAVDPGRAAPGVSSETRVPDARVRSRTRSPASRIQHQESRTTNQEPRIKNHESRIENQESPVASHQSPVASHRSPVGRRRSQDGLPRPKARVASGHTAQSLRNVHCARASWRFPGQLPVPSANVPVSRVSRFEVRVSKFGVRFSVSGFWFTFEYRIFERPGEPGEPGASSAPGPRALRRICCVRVGKRVCDENACARVRLSSTIVVDVRTTETECRTHPTPSPRPVLDARIKS